MRKLKILIFILIVLMIAALFILQGCTVISYKDPVKNIDVQVIHFFVDPEYQGFEWVFDSHVSVNKLKAKTNSELLAMIKYLFEVGVLAAPGGGTQ